VNNGPDAATAPALQDQQSRCRQHSTQACILKPKFDHARILPNAIHQLGERAHVGNSCGSLRAERKIVLDGVVRSANP